MMTQTHCLIAATLFAGPERSVRQNSAILLGSLVPDAAIYTLFFWSKLKGIPEQELWQEVYFTEPMLTFTAIGNSLPLYLSILLLFITIRFLKDRQIQLNLYTSHSANLSSSVIALFSLAAITHLLGDFPVHSSDAHPHFWPLSDWRFHSPVSYWDSNHHGNVFSLFEALLGVVLSVIIYKRFKSFFIRLLTALALTSYIAVPIYFATALPAN